MFSLKKWHQKYGVAIEKHKICVIGFWVERTVTGDWKIKDNTCYVVLKHLVRLSPVITWK